MARPTSDDFVDSILDGTNRWGYDTLNYYFDDSFDPWTSGAQQAFREALGTWSDVADLSFSEVSSSYFADLIEYYLNDAQMTREVDSGTLGAHYTPWNSSHVYPLEGYYNWESFRWPYSSGYSSASLEPGGLGRSVFIHELGHALGLAHPHDADGLSELMPGVFDSEDLGRYDLNQGVYTVMSYNAGWDAQDPWDNGVYTMGHNAAPGALDIAAIQFLYGANTNNNGGDTVYTLSDSMGWGAIWDTGGTDKIRYIGSQDVVVDLRAAALDESENAGGFLSYVNEGGAYGGFTIAGDFTDALADQGRESGVILENVTTGSGNDDITGNNVRNVLKGMEGNDRIGGRGGNDKILGGSGNDTAYGGGEFDVVYGGTGKDNLAGGDQADKLYGESGNDLVKGNTGNDTVNGGLGDDILRGGAGSDKFVFRAGFDADEIRGFALGADVLALDDNLWGGGMTAAAVVAAFAQDLGDDTLFNFGNGDRLMLIDVGNPNALVDDISIV